MSSTVTPSSRAFAERLEHEVDHLRREAERHLVGDEQLRRRREHAGEARASAARLPRACPPTGAAVRRAPGTSRARGRSASLRCARGSENRSCAHRLSFTERCGNRLRDSGTYASPSLAIAVRRLAGDVLAVELDAPGTRASRRPRSRRRATTSPRRWRRARSSPNPRGTSKRHAEQRARLAVGDLQVGDLEQRSGRCSRVDLPSSSSSAVVASTRGAEVGRLHLGAGADLVGACPR